MRSFERVERGIDVELGLVAPGSAAWPRLRRDRPKSTERPRAPCAFPDRSAHPSAAQPARGSGRRSRPRVRPPTACDAGDGEEILDERLRSRVVGALHRRQHARLRERALARGHRVWSERLRPRAMPRLSRRRQTSGNASEARTPSKRRDVAEHTGGEPTAAGGGGLHRQREDFRVRGFHILAGRSFRGRFAPVRRLGRTGRGRPGRDRQYSATLPASGEAR